MDRIIQHRSKAQFASNDDWKRHYAQMVKALLKALDAAGDAEVAAMTLHKSVKGVRQGDEYFAVDVQSGMAGVKKAINRLYHSAKMGEPR